MARFGAILGLLFLPAALAGCVERKIYIRTDPEGAEVSLNKGAPIPGTTPLEKTFDDYGVYTVRITKEGYETLETTAPVGTPWWAYPPFDLVTDVLLPFTIEDHHEFSYTLEKSPPPRGIEEVRARHGEMLERAEAMRREVNEYEEDSEPKEPEPEAEEQ